MLKIFHVFTFVVLGKYENFLTTKVSRIIVAIACYTRWVIQHYIIRIGKKIVVWHSPEHVHVYIQVNKHNHGYQYFFLGKAYFLPVEAGE